MKPSERVHQRARELVTEWDLRTPLSENDLTGAYRRWLEARHIALCEQLDEAYSRELRASVRRPAAELVPVCDFCSAECEHTHQTFFGTYCSNSCAEQARLKLTFSNARRLNR